MTLDDAELVPFERIEALADQLLELARSIHHRIAP